MIEIDQLHPLELDSAIQDFCNIGYDNLASGKATAVYRARLFSGDTEKQAYARGMEVLKRSNLEYERCYAEQAGDDGY